MSNTHPFIALTVGILFYVLGDVSTQEFDLSYRHAFDVLSELFYGKMFSFIRERTDVGGYMKAIESLLPAFTIGGTVPSYLTKLYLLSTILFSPSVRGAVGAVNHLESAPKPLFRGASRKLKKIQMTSAICCERCWRLAQIEESNPTSLIKTFLSNLTAHCKYIAFPITLYRAPNCYSNKTCLDLPAPIRPPLRSTVFYTI